MRILFLNAALRGGAPRSVGAWVRALRRAGHVVVVASPDLETNEHAVWLPRSRWRSGLVEQASPANIVRLARIVRRLQPEVLHTVQYGSHLLARAVAEAFGIAWVHTVLGPLSPGQRFSEGPYVAVSPAFEADARRVGATDVTVIAARLERPQPVMFAPTELATVAFVSRLDGRLIDVARFVLTAFDKVSVPARFIVAGDGDGLLELRRAYPRIAFLGHVAEIGLVHASASLLVGAGRTIIEALGAGVPCINVGLRGFGGVVDGVTADAMAAHNFGGRHVPGDQVPDPLSLTNAIERLLANPASLDALREFGPRYARRYDVHEAVPALEAVYARAIEAARTPGRRRHTAALLGTLLATKVIRALRRRLRGARAL